MKTIIAGSRSLGDAEVSAAMEQCGWVPSIVLSGGARGVDRAGWMWAKQRGIPVVDYPADWKQQGKAAGIMRNRQMADNADALVAVWDGVSPGTRHMIDIAKQRGLHVFVWQPEAQT